MQCGLLGRKLGHSYSPQIHGRLANYDYDLFEKEPEELEEFLLHGDFSGLNVTIPYKKTVLSYCKELSSVAEKLGAVNTLVRRSDGTLVGHNSDYFGFQYMLKKSGLQVKDKKVLVLGSGGASATVVSVLQESGANAVVISRSGENNYQNLHLHKDAYAVVNTTPVGMYPDTESTPLSLEHFPALEGVLDLIYNPARTRLMLEAQSRGLIAMNGLWMLVAQAKESAQWFTGRTLEDDLIPRIYETLRRQMENIVLIGMPGAGKTTIGKLLAKATGKHFVDADEAIEEKAGMPIAEIFRIYGEDGFRKLETHVLNELGKQSSTVISTGGGCVTREENYPALVQNGTIVWMQREISQLPTEGRPLSQKGNLEEMYALREPLYRRFADFAVVNQGSPEQTVQKILTTWGKEKA